MNKLLSTTLVFASIATASATAVFAQAPQHQDQRAASAHHMRAQDRAFARPSERAEVRLAYLKTALKISDTQQPQWEAYADFVRKNAQEREQRYAARRSAEAGGQQRHRPNAIERMERAQSFHAAAVTRINELLAVQKPLYAALSPAQQKVADVLLKPRGHSREKRSMREHGRYGRG